VVGTGGDGRGGGGLALDILPQVVLVLGLEPLGQLPLGGGGEGGWRGCGGLFRVGGEGGGGGGGGLGVVEELRLEGGELVGLLPLVWQAQLRQVDQKIGAGVQLLGVGGGGGGGYHACLVVEVFPVGGVGGGVVGAVLGVVEGGLGGCEGRGVVSRYPLAFVHDDGLHGMPRSEGGGVGDVGVGDLQEQGSRYRVQNEGGGEALLALVVVGVGRVGVGGVAKGTWDVLGVGTVGTVNSGRVGRGGVGGEVVVGLGEGEGAGGRGIADGALWGRDGAFDPLLRIGALLNTRSFGC